MSVSGAPFQGQELKRLKEFLTKMELEYDDGIEYSTCILNDENEIIGTGSVDRNVLKCIAIDPKYQGQGLSAMILSELIQYEFEQGRTHFFIYTKPQNLEMFADMGFYKILQTEYVLFMENRRDGFGNFLEQVRKETQEKLCELEACVTESKGVGAIVANCNPFTLGHRYLIERALEESDYVHLFLLSDERSTFSPKERYDMVCEGIRDLERVILHWTSDYMVSAATFPTYFFKDKVEGQKANCRLDLELFAQRIAPALGISKRFVGTEPNCAVTGVYNQLMKEVLPQYGIEVREIEREQIQEVPISASFVRRCIGEEKWEDIHSMVPEGVYEYLKKISG